MNYRLIQISLIRKIQSSRKILNRKSSQLIVIYLCLIEHIADE